MTKTELQAIVQAIASLRTSLTDAQALENIVIFPKWKVDTEYEIDCRCQYNGVLYKCIKAHMSQDGATPDVASDFWKTV